MKKSFILLTLGFLGVVATGCGNQNSSSQSNNANSNNITLDDDYPSNQSYSGGSNQQSGGNTTVSDKQKVINYLKLNGTTEYNMIATSSEGTMLGYDSTNDVFAVGYTTTSGSTNTTSVYFISYNSTSGYGSTTIKSNSIVTFRCYLYVTVYNHRLSDINIDYVEINQYSSSATESIASIISGSAELSFNCASLFLANNGLPYVF